MAKTLNFSIQLVQSLSKRMRCAFVQMVHFLKIEIIRQWLFSSIFCCRLDRRKLKECMSPKGHECVVEKHFEASCPTFSKTIRQFRRLFSSVSIVFIFGKLAEVFNYKRCLYLLQKLLVAIFLKAKSLRQVVCKLQLDSTASVPADIGH